jgi:hypothetical protein
MGTVSSRPDLVGDHDEGCTASFGRWIPEDGVASDVLDHLQYFCHSTGAATGDVRADQSLRRDVTRGCSESRGPRVVCVAQR